LEIGRITRMKKTYERRLVKELESNKEKRRKKRKS
jgi:hypothetical protein